MKERAGMPAYAKDAKVVCFFQGAFTFTARYTTLGFIDPANPRRRRDVADGLRPDRADAGGREADRGPGEARRQLT